MSLVPMVGAAWGAGAPTGSAGDAGAEARTRPPTLVILAAGSGRRFGGAKQFAPAGPADEPLLAYTLHDAGLAGFARAVLVVPPGQGPPEGRYHRWAPAGLAVGAVEQRGGKPRAAPWGTGHAVLAATRELSGCPFAVANADDFYGRDALAILGAFLRDGADQEHGLITYRLGHTMEHADGVSRAVCKIHGGTLWALEEARDVRRTAAGFEGRMMDGSPRQLAPDAPVSMNLWGFRGDFPAALESAWRRFLRAAPGPEAEFMLPDAVDGLVRTRTITVRALPAGGRPFGLTRAQDLAVVRRRIASLVARGVYPADLRGRAP
ncbi:MAG TPA: NTP transferase domain-containing protein [Longimicrobiales bacterium]|nr:NTP transferase domain-containing protein [Longimicrobiales bacterium]